MIIAKIESFPLRRGVAFVLKTLLQKIFGAGRNSAGAALASVLWQHSTEGRTPDAAARRHPLKTGSVRRLRDRRSLAC
jgi:hypothetical protein